MPTFIEGAKVIALQAWSMWGLYILGLFSFLDATLPYLTDYPGFATPAFSAAIAAVSAVTAFLRLLPQPGLKTVVDSSK